MLLINSLRPQFQAAGFHPGVLPDVAQIHPCVDLSRSPIDPTVASNRDCPEWSNRQRWVKQHHQLGFSSHHVLDVATGDSAIVAPIFCRTVREQSINGCEFAALNELLQLHFPCVMALELLLSMRLLPARFHEFLMSPFRIVKDALLCGSRVFSFIENLSAANALKSPLGLLGVSCLGTSSSCRKSTSM